MAIHQGKGCPILLHQENATSLEGDKLSDTLIPQENAASLEGAKKDGGGTATTSATLFVAMATPKAVTLTHQNIAAGQKASSMTKGHGCAINLHLKKVPLARRMIESWWWDRHHFSHIIC